MMMAPLLLLLALIAADIDHLAAAREAQRRGDDPAGVLRHLDAAIAANKTNRDAYLLAGDLALKLGDYKVAADRFRTGLEQCKGDADLTRGLAEALMPVAPGIALNLLSANLEKNPGHIPSLMLLAEQQFDAEQTDALDLTLARLFTMAPDHSGAWALRAAQGYLRGDEPAGDAARRRALLGNSADPAVDHLIGRKLARRYRFEQAIAFQERALKIDPKFRDARLELAQDLLRLGRDEDRAWQIIAEIHHDDPYNVIAFNLISLHDMAGQFATLMTEGLVLRMPKREAAVYGQHALRWLAAARQDMSSRYHLPLKQTVIVEMYGHERDFAVRTFGMPGAGGLYGVCFGNVITARSGNAYLPGAPNWMSTLWHEFGHTMALHLSDNRVPRWFTEGLSVYEQWRADPTSGVRMDVAFKQRILAGELFPITKLSEAFLSPRSGKELMFAYFEAGLLVEHIVQQRGFDSVLAVLSDLGANKPIEKALADRVAPVDQLQTTFFAFARKRAEDYAPRLDLTVPEKPDPADVKALEAWLAAHPDSYWALSNLARHRVAAGMWPEARQLLQQLVNLAPEDESMFKLAEAHGRLKDQAARLEMLTRLAEQSDGAAPAFLELMRTNIDPALARRYAQRYLAVNPMLPEAYNIIARSSVALSDRKSAVEALESLIALDAPDPAEAHYRLATLLVADDPAAAKRHVLDALTRAPRYRDAQKLLLQLTDKP